MARAVHNHKTNLSHNKNGNDSTKELQTTQQGNGCLGNQNTGTTRDEHYKNVRIWVRRSPQKSRLSFDQFPRLKQGEMMIIHGDVETEYKVTPNGNFMEIHSIGGKMAAIRSTAQVGTFLKWMLQPEVNREMENKHRKQMMWFLAQFWTSPNHNCFRGTFNSVLYLKVIEAKQALKNRA